MFVIQLTKFYQYTENSAREIYETYMKTARVGI